MTKNEELTDEMVNALNKGFKELHLPFHAFGTAEEHLIHISTHEFSWLEHAHSKFAYDPRKSAKENLATFSKQIEDEYGSDRGDYVSQAIRASSLSKDNPNIFKETLKTWKDQLAARNLSDMLRNWHLANDLGMSNEDAIKSAKVAMKYFQKFVKEHGRESPVK